MPQEGRPLTILCGGPEPIAAVIDAPRASGTDGVALWFAKLDTLRERIPHYLELLGTEELERAARFRFDVDRERFIIAHGLLRTLLGERLGARPGELRIARGPYGKPYIEGTDLRFNLSDTKDALLIAITQGGEIGADIETMARTVDHMAVGAHYFTPEEMRSIRQAANHGTNSDQSTCTVDPLGRHTGAAQDPAKRRFLEFWTRKEAVLKASGVGIMDDLRVLRVDGEVNEMTITHEAFVQHAAATYHVHTWMYGEDHILSVAQQGPIKHVILLHA